MALLYPPYIEGTIPAFYGQTLKVPFQHNPTINKNDYRGFVVKFKEVNTNTVLFVANTTSEDALNKTIVFNLESYTNKLRENDFYKIQIAYRDNDMNEGYYSTVGVVKYTSAPVLELIRGDKTSFDPNNINILTQEVVSQYTNTDVYEKLYSTQLTIKDSKGNIFYQSEEIIHNNFGDDNNIVNSSDDSLDQYITQYEHYNLYKQLSDGEIYTIQVVGTTINGLECASPIYQTRNAWTFDGFYGYYLEAERDFEDGQINLVLHQDFTGASALKGLFLLSKQDCINNPHTWYPLKYISLDGTEFSNQIYKAYSDKVVEQGGVYQYAIQQFSGNFTSNKMLSNTVTADFEDIFLYDGERQLKLKFNPKVSSFKTTKLENKVDTVGGVYPVFFRNGYTNYKEFPISALISYLSDENNEFMLNEDFGLNNSNDPIRKQTPGDDTGIKSSVDRFDIQSVNYKRADGIDGTTENENLIYNGNADNIMNVLSGNDDVTEEKDSWGNVISVKTNWDASRNTSLGANNYVSERLFKLKVLDWLNDGKPKLFKSAVEGNYIVRLMNISLAPTDQLGRMLHTVSGTAYEVAEINFDNLKLYNFIDLTVPELKTVLTPYSFDLSDNDAYSGVSDNTDNPYHIIYLPTNPVYNPQFTNMPFGTKIRFTDSTGLQSVIEIFMRDSYLVEENIPFSKIEVQFPGQEQQGLFNVFYANTVKDWISYVKSISFRTVPLQSFSDDDREIDIIKKINAVNDFEYSYINKTISFNHNEISSVKYLKFEKKGFTLPSNSDEKDDYKIKVWFSKKRYGIVNNEEIENDPDQTIDLSDLDSYTFPMVHSKFYNIVIGKQIIGYIAYDLNIQRVEISINDIIKEKIDNNNLFVDYSKVDNEIDLTTKYNYTKDSIEIIGSMENNRSSLISFSNLTNNEHKKYYATAYLEKGKQYYFSCEKTNPFWDSNNSILIKYAGMNDTSWTDWGSENNFLTFIGDSNTYKIFIKITNAVIPGQNVNTTIKLNFSPWWIQGYKYRCNLGETFQHKDDLIDDSSLVIAFGDDASGNQIAWYTDDEGVNVNASTN